MIKVLKGMKDIYYGNMEKFEKVEKTAEKTFKQYGFSKIITPVLEETQLFKRGVGEETDVVSKEMYSFETKGTDKTEITMRPEGTAGVVRSYLENGFHKEQPVVKWFYSGPMFRYEKPQKGRYREFFQVGVEMFGIKDPLADAEIIKMGHHFIKNLGINNITVEINTLGDKKAREDYTLELRKFLKENEDKICDKCKERSVKNPLRVLDCKNENCQKVYENAPILLDYLSKESKDYYEKVKDYLSKLEISYVENNKLVRGLDYYSDTVFEIKANEGLGAQSTVLAGGRYDKLLTILGDVNIPAIGFASGIDRLSLLLKDEESEKEGAYLVYFPEYKDYALEIATKLRENNISVQYEYEDKSFKSQMKKADKMNVKHVIILGEEEYNSKTIVLKDFVNRTQEILKVEDAIERIK